MDKTEGLLRTLAIDLLVLDPDELSREYQLDQLESLDVVSLLFEIEENLGVQFDEETAKDFTTFGDVLDYCRAHAEA